MAELKESLNANIGRRVVQLLLLVMLIIWSGIGYQVWSSYDNTREEAETNALNLARSLAAHTSSIFESIEGRLDAVMGEVEKAKPLPPLSTAATELLIRHASASQSIDAISLFDKNGNMLQSAIRSNGEFITPERIINISDRGYFRHLSTMDSGHFPHSHIGQPIKGRISGKWLLPVGMAIYSTGGTFDGIILATIDLHSMWQEFYEGFKLAADNSIALVSGDGYFMARAPFNAFFFSRNFADNVFFAEVLPHRNSGIFHDRQSIDKKNRLIAFQKLEGRPFAISVTQTSQWVLKQWKQDTITIVLIGLVATILLVYFARSIATQAAQLSGYQEELENLVSERTEELESSEARLRSNLEVMDVISGLQAHFIREPEPTLMFDSLLKDILDLTDSEYGFVGDVLQDESGRDFLKAYAFSNVAWNDETRRFYEENKAKGFVFTKLDNLFGHVITDREVVITNDPAHDPRRCGPPAGHPTINAFLGIPVWYGERLVGEIGLANRPGGYDQQLLDHIQPIVEACGRIIVARWEREARLAAEEALRKSEQYQQWLLSSLPVAVVVHDSDSVIQYCNDTALEILGLTMEQAMGEESLDPDWHFIREDGSTIPVERYPANQVIANGQLLANQIVGVIRHTDEPPVWALVHAFPDFDQHGNLRRVIVSFIDITERRRMERLMVQTEKMMSVGGLAAGMAHELNNPLGGILQGIQNIQRRLSSDLDKNIEVSQELGLDLTRVQQYFEQRGIAKFLKGINDAGERAAIIVNNMLQFSRKSESELHPECINSLIDTALELAAVDYDLKKKYDFRQIEIIKEYDETLPAVACIASEIQQVLLNILRNAAQALFEGKVEQPRIIVRSNSKHDMVCFEVEDNGPGIDNETKEHVFDPFFTTRKVGEGTGLGLSVSYFIVSEEHSGTISVDSQPGKGATFRICLPVK